MFVFPANNAGYKKRKKAFRACEQCKRGRRKCLPTDNDDRCKSCSELDIACSLAPEVPKKRLRMSSQIGTGQVPNGVGGGSESDAEFDAPSNETRFISQLVPTSDLVMVGDPDRDQVGLWVCRRNEELTAPNRIRVSVPACLDRFVLAHLNSLHAFEFPPEASRDALVDLFFEVVEPVLPLVDRAGFLETYRRRNFSVPLLHAIVLVSSRHRKAEEYLGGISPRQFAADYSAKIRALLYAGIETNPMTLARIHALLSLHSEGPDGFSEGSRNLFTALNYAYSTGIHLRRTSPEDTHLMTSRRKLWWSLWCLDKFSACENGMPMLTNRADIGEVDFSEVPSTGPFSSMFMVCDQLLRVIRLYRPNVGEVERADFEVASPPADDGTESTALFRLILITTRILKLRRVGHNSELLPVLCLQVCDILEQYHDMAPLPFLPYAASVTLAIFARLFHYQSSRQGWRRGIAILNSLAKYWWAAEAVAAMGQRVFDKLESETQSQSSVDEEANLELDVSSFLGQTSVLGDYDKEGLDAWFPSALVDFSFLSPLDTDGPSDVAK